MEYNIKSPLGDKILIVDWPENCTKLGILVSGGFDSALMLYLWAKLSISNDKQILAITTDRGRGAKEFASEIISKVNALTGKNIKQVILPVPAQAHHSQQVGWIAYPAMKKKLIDCDCLMNAATDNPNTVNLSSGPDRGPLDKVDLYPDRKFPFRYLNKTHTVSLMHQLGLNWIMEMSHTCTESNDLRCGVCWQCRERVWAFQQLGLTDTGKY